MSNTVKQHWQVKILLQSRYSKHLFTISDYKTCSSEKKRPFVAGISTKEKRIFCRGCPGKDISEDIGGKHTVLRAVTSSTKIPYSYPHTSNYLIFGVKSGQLFFQSNCIQIFHMCSRTGMVFAVKCTPQYKLITLLINVSRFLQNRVTYQNITPCTKYVQHSFPTFSENIYLIGYDRIA